jgi:hypothetical protein
MLSVTLIIFTNSSTEWWYLSYSIHSDSVVSPLQWQFTSKKTAFLRSDVSPFDRGSSTEFRTISTQNAPFCSMDRLTGVDSEYMVAMPKYLSLSKDSAFKHICKTKLEGLRLRRRFCGSFQRIYYHKQLTKYAC